MTKVMVCDRCGARVPLVEDAADVDGLHGKCGCGGFFYLPDWPPASLAALDDQDPPTGEDAAT